MSSDARHSQRKAKRGWYGPMNATARAISIVIYSWHCAGCQQVLRGAA